MTAKKNTPTKKETTSKKSLDQKDKTTPPFWKKHFVKLFLALLLIVSILWGWVANGQLQKEHEQKLSALKQSHQTTLQELKTLKNEEVTQTLALAVRSELIDDNNDQVNQYFLQMLKQPTVERVMLVNHQTGKIILSTNKKDETATFGHKELYSTNEVVVKQKEGSPFAATPVMGLNSQLAVLIIEFSQER